MEMKDHLQLSIARNRVWRVLRDRPVAWRLADANSHQDGTMRQENRDLSRKAVVITQHLFVHLLHESVHLFAVAALAPKALI